MLHKTHLIFVSIVLYIFIGIGQRLPLANAASIYWTGTTGDWSDPMNWGGAEPTNADYAYIYNGGTVEITLTGEKCSTLYLGDSGTGHEGTVHFNGGNLYALSQFVGYNGSGTFLHSGGANSASILNLGYKANSQGNYVLSDSAVLTAQDEKIGGQGVGNFTQTGGTNSSTTLLVYVNSSYTLSGGQVSVSSETIFGNNARFIQSGGTHEISSRLFLSDSASYMLSEGTLHSRILDISSEASFQQTSGNYTVSESVSSTSKYTLAGNGTLTVGDTFASSRFEWFCNGLTVPKLYLRNVAMGFDFNVASLLNGSLNHGMALIESPFYLEITNNAKATHSDSTTTTINKLTLGTDAGNGSYELGGSGQLNLGLCHVGYSNQGSFIQSAESSVSGGELHIGYNVGSSGFYELSGSAQLNNGLGLYVGDSGTGTFTQLGGVHTIPCANFILSNKTGSNGTYNLNGGTLVIYALKKGSGTATFNFGGGIIQARNGFSTGMPMTLTGIGGDANVDTNGKTVTFSGFLTGPGGLNKLGSGTLTLKAKNSYSGDTMVQGGVLSIEGGIDPLGTSLIDVKTSGKVLFKTMNINSPDLDIYTTGTGIFEVIDGTHVVGAISGTGTTQVDSAANLTATSIVQNTLKIGGMGSAAAASSASEDTALSVPEPASILLLGIAAAGLATAWKRRRK